MAAYGPDYAGIQGPTKEVGGLRRDSDVRAGGPLVIVYSEDLERSVEAVTAAGGTIVTPIHAFPGGRRFHFGDPAGNELAVSATEQIRRRLAVLVECADVADDLISVPSAPVT
jgi:uncharacterized protein